MRVIAPPNKKEDFDGTVFLKCVSKKVKLAKAVYNKYFDDNFIINNIIKRGNWRCLYSPLLNNKIENMIQAIEEEYGLTRECLKSAKAKLHVYLHVF